MKTLLYAHLSYKKIALAMLKNCDTAKHVSTPGQAFKTRSFAYCSVISLMGLKENPLTKS